MNKTDKETFIKKQEQRVIVPTNKHFTEQDHKEIQKYIIMIYALGIILSILYTIYIYSADTTDFSVLITVLLFTIMFYIMNGIFSYMDPISSFDKELADYANIETSGSVIVQASLAITVFLNFVNGNTKISNIRIIFPVVMSFVFSALTILVVWVPKTGGKYVRLLRDTKTILLVSSIATIIIGMFNILNFFWTNPT